MPYDHIAAADVLDALDPAHPVTPACTYVAPVAGGILHARSRSAAT